MELIETIAVADTLGEGALWDVATQSFWWTDIKGKRLHRYDWNRRSLKSFATPERLCSFGFIENSTRLIAAFESGFALYDPVTAATEWLARPETDIARNRFNDGRVDRQGRFWSGTMEEPDDRSGQANLYCLDGAGKARRMASGIDISNAICWSPDSRHFYFADSPKRTIFVYDFDQASGAISSRRVFAETPEGAFPDGANVDAEGYLWNAHWGVGRVVRYTPDGRIDRVVEVPASLTTCIAFGGPDLDLLFVTSARDSLDAASLANEAGAGNVFVYNMGIRGLPDRRYVFDRAGG